MSGKAEIGKAVVGAVEDLVRAGTEGASPLSRLQAEAGAVLSDPARSISPALARLRDDFGYSFKEPDPSAMAYGTLSGFKPNVTMTSAIEAATKESERLGGKHVILDWAHPGEPKTGVFVQAGDLAKDIKADWSFTRDRQIMNNHDFGVPDSRKPSGLFDRAHLEFANLIARF